MSNDCRGGRRLTEGVLAFLRAEGSEFRLKVSFKTTNLSSWQRYHWVITFHKQSFWPPAGAVSSGHFNTVIWLHKGGGGKNTHFPRLRCRFLARVDILSSFLFPRITVDTASDYQPQSSSLSSAVTELLQLLHPIASCLLSAVYLYTVFVMLRNQITMQLVSSKQDLSCLGCSELCCTSPLLLWESDLKKKKKPKKLLLRGISPRPPGDFSATFPKQNQPFLFSFDFVSLNKHFADIPEGIPLTEQIRAARPERHKRRKTGSVSVSMRLHSLFVMSRLSSLFDRNTLACHFIRYACWVVR